MKLICAFLILMLAGACNQMSGVNDFIYEDELSSDDTTDDSDSETDSETDSSTETGTSSDT